jgi:UTP--glucose-1-phosphate uridylyltransferase
VGYLLDQIDAATRNTLLRYGFDEEQFEHLRRAVADGTLSPEQNLLHGRIEPPVADDITAIPALDDPARRTVYERGAAAIRRGEVAMAVLNGGMATRFGGVVKGVVEAVDGRSFIEWKLLDARRVEHALGGAVPCVVMNSFATEQATQHHLESIRKQERSIAEPILFSQFISLRLNPNGSLFIESDGRPSLYAPGHGDFVPAIRRSGTLALLRDRGARYIMLSNVDNLGARVDPIVAGMHITAGRPVTVEVAAKQPGDAGGAPAKVDGRIVHVEGFRFPPSFDQDSIPVFNTNSFIFDLDALDRDYPLTWFYVEKTVEDRPAVQLERLVNELTSFLPATFLEVPRSGPNGRFFPIKSPHDLEAARPALADMLRSSLTHADDPASN